MIENSINNSNIFSYSLNNINNNTSHLNKNDLYHIKNIENCTH